jgi:hypothetical protein
VVGAGGGLGELAAQPGRDEHVEFAPRRDHRRGGGAVTGGSVGAQDALGGSHSNPASPASLRLVFPI